MEHNCVNVFDEVNFNYKNIKQDQVTILSSLTN